MKTASPVRILIVDDDLETCRLIAELVATPERELHEAQTATDAIERARREPFDLVISDIDLNASESGLDVLKAFKDANPAGEVLLISGFGTLDTAVQAVREGVRSVHIIDGGVPSALMLEVLTADGVGTAVRSDAGPHFLEDSRAYLMDAPPAG